LSSRAIILDRAGVTKGALYHHFENKDALGYAVVDEVIGDMLYDKWLRPLEHAENPIDALARIVQSISTKPDWLWARSTTWRRRCLCSMKVSGSGWRSS
jgi:AcrR family transcriptional regulator